MARRSPADTRRRLQPGGGARRAARAGGVRGAAAARRAVPAGAPAARQGRVDRVHAQLRVRARARAARLAPARAHCAAT